MTRRALPVRARSRPGRIRARLLPVVVALLAGGLALPATPASVVSAASATPASTTATADVARRLPVASVRAVVADSHKHLYVATDRGVLVTDPAGVRIRTISYNQVLDLALSPDGSRAYLSERGNVAISVFDTVSLRMLARYPLPPGLCPVSVAVTRTHIAFGYTCDGDFGGVGFLPLARPRAKPVLVVDPTFASRVSSRVSPASLLPVVPDVS